MTKKILDFYNVICYNLFMIEIKQPKEII
jgi:hypothetical protein